MTTEVPPAYSPETLKSEFETLVNKAEPLSPENEAKANDALKDALSGEEMKKSVAEEISKLTGYALGIDNSFYRASAQFAEIIKIAGPIQQEVRTMKAQWDEKHKVYVDLMWESRNTAIKAKAAADDFAKDFTDMLKAAEVSLEEKKKEIEAYRDQLRKDQQDAQRVSQRFHDLKDWIIRFKSKFSTIGEELRAANEKKITQLNGEISALEGTLSSIDATIGKLTKALKITTGLGAGCGLLGYLCPVFWYGAAAAAVAATGQAAALGYYKYTRAKAEKELDSKRNERDRLQNDVNSILAVRKALEGVGQDADNIISKLAAFGTVWAMIAADLGEIEAKMAFANSSAARFMFNKRLDTVSAMYSALSFALYKYATTVSDDQLFAGRKK